MRIFWYVIHIPKNTYFSRTPFDNKLRSGIEIQTERFMK